MSNLSRCQKSDVLQNKHVERHLAIEVRDFQQNERASNHQHLHEGLTSVKETILVSQDEDELQGRMGDARQMEYRVSR